MQPLRPHPDSPPAPVRGVEAQALRRAGDRLTLRYRIVGATPALVVPPPAPPIRTDGLWRTTCLEAFVRPSSGRAYYELNLAPSGQWAAYRFDGYRSGMAPAPLQPQIEVRPTPDGLELSATLDLPEPGPWRVGLTAVIEATDGAVGHWSLAHPAGKPDFHHPDCLVLDLPPSEAP